ncbi:signal peptidase I [Pseudactinotalea suaedae]|uniref:signal peptidase I n=1 Tax=Pseudactinotalea suaedae TaxID=1524924 RepID=UPI0012E2CD56|nr:signal peptidase I [Pseudactinotalea suaedae]
MITQAPDRAGTGACVTPSKAESPTRSRAATILGWLLVAVAAALLWPAQWGGLTGLTIVSGHSMEPTYYTGDLVVTWRQAGYEPGDVVSYTVPDDQPGAGGHVIHRVATADRLDSGEMVYTTVGDNNPAADQWTLTADDIAGAAVLHVPGLGRFLGPAVLPILVAGALGGIVTVMLWSSRPEDEETDEADDGAPTLEETAP